MSQDQFTANSTPEAPGRARLRLSPPIQLVIFFCAFVPTLVLVGIAHRNLIRREARLQAKLERERAKRVELTSVEPLAAEFKQVSDEVVLRSKVIGHLDSFHPIEQFAMRELASVLDGAQDVKVTQINFTKGVTLSGVATSEDAAKSFVAQINHLSRFDKGAFNANTNAKDGEFGFSAAFDYSPPLPTTDNQGKDALADHPAASGHKTKDVER